MKEVTESDFEDQVLTLSHKDIVLLDVYADWCYPCKAQYPILEQLDSNWGFYNYASLRKVNADENPALIKRLGVRGIPTLLWFVDGQEVHREVGLKSKKELLDITNRWI